MNNLSQDEELEAAFSRVLNHPNFRKYSRKDLSSCKIFCEVIRQSPHETVLQLREDLEEIAFGTDDHNEASGFLLSFAALGGGFSNSPIVDKGVNLVGDGNFSNLDEARECFSDIPVNNVAHFTEWAISVPFGQRSLATVAAMDALLKRIVRIQDNDYLALLTHQKINTVLYYTLGDEDQMFEVGNYACENLSDEFNIDEQIPERLWEAFNSRPQREVDNIVQKWWGTRSDTPNDFFIALDWQREGYIQIHKGKNYGETVAEYILSCCEPANTELEQPTRVNYGIKAISLNPFLADDLYQALTKKRPYEWLVNFDIPLRASYLEELFSAGVLDRQRILSALDYGISKKWDKNHRTDFNKLRDLISF